MPFTLLCHLPDLDAKGQLVGHRPDYRYQADTEAAAWALLAEASESPDNFWSKFQLFSEEGRELRCLVRDGGQWITRQEAPGRSGSGLQGRT